MTTMLEIKVSEIGTRWFARIVQRNAHHARWRVLQRSFATAEEATDWVCTITKAGKAKAWSPS